MTTESTGARCRTCGYVRQASDFYESATECTTCKKDRSRQARMLAAQKIAFAERVIELFADLASQGWRPDLCRHAKQGSVGAVNTEPSPSTEPQEVQP